VAWLFIIGPWCLGFLVLTPISDRRSLQLIIGCRGQAMKKIRAKATDETDFSILGIADLYMMEETLIKKANYLLSDGATVDIGVFNILVGGYKVGVYIHRDADGKILEGTVCKFKELSGLEWFQALHQGLFGESLN
jgi:hypothetical protein